MNRKILNIWTIYKDAIDTPKQYRVRRYELNIHTNDTFDTDSYDECVQYIYGSSITHGTGSPVRMERDPSDDPVILESWL